MGLCRSGDHCGISEPKYRGNLSTMVRYKDLTFNMFSVTVGEDNCIIKL